MKEERRKSGRKVESGGGERERGKKKEGEAVGKEASPRDGRGPDESPRISFLQDTDPCPFIPLTSFGDNVSMDKSHSRSSTPPTSPNTIVPYLGRLCCASFCKLNIAHRNRKISKRSLPQIRHNNFECHKAFACRIWGRCPKDRGGFTPVFLFPAQIE